jgi:hypothetical protein
MSTFPSSPKEPSPNRWYYANAQGKPFGPVSFDTLKSLAVAGTIKQGTLVTPEAKTLWKPFSEVVPEPFSSSPSSAANRISEAGGTELRQSAEISERYDHHVKRRGVVELASSVSATQNTDSRAANALNFGCLLSTGASMPFFIGLLLSLTGIGAILGIPLMLVSVAMFFGAPILGYCVKPPTWLSGSCPYCTYPEVKASHNEPGVNCPACKKRIIIRENRFLKTN